MVVAKDENDEVYLKESYDYYPFGKIMPNRSQVSGEQPATFKYTGKELDDENALEWYYFGARYYDGEVGRFWVIDPKHYLRPWESPYSFCANNPLKRVDEDGQSWTLTMPWLTLADGPLPVGDLIYGVGVVVEGAIIINQMNKSKQKKTDSKTAEEARKKLAKPIELKLRRIKGDKNTPPNLSPKNPKDPGTKVPWWVPLLRLLHQVDDALPVENNNTERQEQKKEEELKRKKEAPKRTEEKNKTDEDRHEKVQE